MNYFRPFIPNFSHETACIKRLLSNHEEDIVWTIEHTNAVHRVATLLEQRLEMMIPDTKRPLVVAVETDEFGYVAMLAQKDSEGKERPCCLHSREWGPVEAQAPPAEK